MTKKDTNYEWMGWAIAIVIGIGFIFFLTTSNAKHNDSPADSDTSWHCVDATSYNGNAYDDNECTNGDETKYVSDSQAKALDPSYSPGKSGASYYNNK